MSEPTDHKPSGEVSAIPAARAEIRQWQSEQLFGEANEARIIHGNEVYRLLRTRNDKLILVK